MSKHKSRLLRLFISYARESETIRVALWVAERIAGDHHAFPISQRRFPNSFQPGFQILYSLLERLNQFLLLLNRFDGDHTKIGISQRLCPMGLAYDLWEEWLDLLSDKSDRGWS